MKGCRIFIFSMAYFVNLVNVAFVFIYRTSKNRKRKEQSKQEDKKKTFASFFLLEFTCGL